VHLVSFRYKNISRCAVLCMSNTAFVCTSTGKEMVTRLNFELMYNTCNIKLQFLFNLKLICHRIINHVIKDWTVARDSTQSFKCLSNDSPIQQLV